MSKINFLKFPKKQYKDLFYSNTIIIFAAKLISYDEINRTLETHR